MASSCIFQMNIIDKIFVGRSFQFLALFKNYWQFLLQKCEDREIKLCGLLAAAGLSTCQFLKEIPVNQWERYAVTTLIDCRSILDPVLSVNHIGK